MNREKVAEQLLEEYRVTALLWNQAVKDHDKFSDIYYYGKMQGISGAANSLGYYLNRDVNEFSCNQIEKIFISDTVTKKIIEREIQ